MRSRRTSFLLLVALAALVAPGQAASKEIVTTACGRDRCRTVVGGVSGVAVLPARVRAPRCGRYYTLAVRVEADGRVMRWRIVYEARRHLVRAGNDATRSFLGSRWRVLEPGVRRAYSLAVEGLAPMPAPPRSTRARCTSGASGCCRRPRSWPLRSHGEGSCP